MQNFRPISEEIKNHMPIFEIALSPHRNAMRAQYKDRCQKSTNGVGIVTPLHSAWTEASPSLTLRSHAVGHESYRIR